jgi:phosphohistidine phosphatase
MRTLTLVRHAKSSWSDPALTDAMRPLNARGIAAGPVIANWLAGHVRKPDAVRCSPAERTRATWSMLVGAWGPEHPPCSFDECLYMAPAATLQQSICATSDDQAHLMIIGHNPGLQDLALALAERAAVPDHGVDRAADYAALVAKFPTAAVAVLTFGVPSWSAVRAQAGQLLHFVSPRRLAVSGT